MIGPSKLIKMIILWKETAGKVKIWEFVLGLLLIQSAPEEEGQL